MIKEEAKKKFKLSAIYNAGAESGDNVYLGTDPS